MSRQTKRDRVWDTALKLALELEEFDIAEVLVESDLDDRSKRTTRDVLSTMADQGWLQKQTSETTGRRLYAAGDRLLEMRKES